MIVIRMARGGRKKRPIFTIVAADARSPRDGCYLEKLGKYDPQAENPLADVNVDSISGWVSKGAQLSDTVRTLLNRSKIQLNLNA